MSETEDSLDHSSCDSSFDSNNSFYSTTTSDSQDNDNFIDNSPSNSFIQDHDLFHHQYQSQVINKITAVLSELASDSSHYNPLLDTPTVKVETSADPATPFCFRTTATFPANSAPAAFALFAAIPLRSKWDAMCQSIQILKTIDPLTFIYHLKLKATWPTTPRDSLMIAAFRKLKDGRFISVAWSIEDDSLCPADPTGAYIRMHTRISANLFTPTSPTSFLLSQLIDADPKGSIPSYVIKKVSAKSFPATIESIKQAINEADSDFYNQTVGKLKVDDLEDDQIEDKSSEQLRDIQSRLDRIETQLKSLNKTNTNTNTNNSNQQALIKYAPLLLSATSLLLLLNLNFRKK